MEKNCITCIWCKVCDFNINDRICKNKSSKLYGHIFSKEDAQNQTCDCSETQRMYDYLHLTAHQFAQKYL